MSGRYYFWYSVFSALHRVSSKPVPAVSTLPLNPDISCTHQALHMLAALEAGWLTVLMSNPLWVINTRCLFHVYLAGRDVVSVMVIPARQSNHPAIEPSTSWVVGNSKGSLYHTNHPPMKVVLAVPARCSWLCTLVTPLPRLLLPALSSAPYTCVHITCGVAWEEIVREEGAGGLYTGVAAALLLCVNPGIQELH